MLFALGLSRQAEASLSTQLVAGLAYGHLVFLVPAADSSSPYVTLCLINLQHGFLDPRREWVVDASKVQGEYQDLFDQCQRPKDILQPGGDRPLFEREGVSVTPVVNILKADFDIFINDALTALQRRLIEPPMRSASQNQLKIDEINADTIKNLFSTQDLEGYLAGRLKNIQQHIHKDIPRRSQSAAAVGEEDATNTTREGHDCDVSGSTTQSALDSLIGSPEKPCADCADGAGPKSPAFAPAHESPPIADAAGNFSPIPLASPHSSVGELAEEGDSPTDISSPLLQMFRGGTQLSSPRPPAANKASSSGDLLREESSVEPFLDPNTSFFELPTWQQDFLWRILRGVLIFVELAPTGAGAKLNFRLMLLSMELEISGRERCLEWGEFEQLKETSVSTLSKQLSVEFAAGVDGVLLKTDLSTWPPQLKGERIRTHTFAPMDSEAYNNIVRAIKKWVQARESTGQTIINEPDDDKRYLLIGRLSTHERYTTSNLKEYIEGRLCTTAQFFTNYEKGLAPRQPWSGVSCDSTPSFWEDVDAYKSHRNRSFLGPRNGGPPGATVTPADQSIVKLDEEHEREIHRHTPNRCHC